MKKILLTCLLLLVPLIASAQNITTTTCPGVGCVNFSTAGQGTIGIQITGTWVGTITFQGTINNVDYVSISVTPSSSSTTTSTTTGNGVWTTAVAGLTQVRVVFTAYTSGTAVVNFRTTATTKGTTGGGGGGGGVTSIGTTSPITGGTITTTGTIACATCAVMGGSDTQVLFNDSGVIGGDAGLIYNKTTDTLQLAAQPLLTGFSDTANNSEPSLRVYPNTGTDVSFVLSSSYTDTDHWNGLWVSLSGTTATIQTQTDGGGATGALNLRGGVNGLTLSAVGGPTKINNLTYPAADGSAGDYLSTDGAGTLSFTTPATTTVNNLKFKNGKGIQTDITTNDTLVMQAYDVNDTTYRTFGTLTAGNTPSFAIAAPSGGTVSVAATTLSIGGNAIGATVAKSQLGFTVDGAGSTITTGTKGFITVPYNCTITSVTVLSTDASVTSGSIVIDVWKDTYANYPPTVADTITASAKPTITSATKSQDNTLTGWTTTVTAGDVFAFNVDSVTSLTRVTLILGVTIN